MKPRILLVDDNPREAELARLAFREHGCDGGAIQTAPGVAEALQTIAAALPRLVLLDLKLAEASGLELLARLKSDVRTRAVPVVVMTASREPHDIAESYRLGANGYVVKPVDFERFKDVARRLCDYWLVLNEIPQEN
jgi:two-component system, response regulator